MTFLVVTGMLLLGAGSETVMRRIAATRPLAGVWWYGSWAVTETVLAAFFAAEGNWGWAAVMGVCAAVNGIQCRNHWNRRKRKRAAALAGAKSRARIAALVARVRETANPRRVLRPVPGGAR